MKKALYILLPLALVLTLVMALVPAQIAGAKAGGPVACPPDFSGTGNGVGNINETWLKTVPAGTTVTASVTAGTGYTSDSVDISVGTQSETGTLDSEETMDVSDTFPGGGDVTITIYANSNRLGSNISYSVTFRCNANAPAGDSGTNPPPPPPPAITDNRVNASDTFESGKAFFMDMGNSDETQNGIFVYDFVDVENAEGEMETQGQLMCHASWWDIQQQPAYPAANTLLGSSSDGTCQIHKLTTGEYQITIGPDADGLVRVWIWQGIPPEENSMYHKDYNIYD